MQTYTPVVTMTDMEKRRVHLTPIQVYQSFGSMPLLMGTIAWIVHYVPINQDDQTKLLRQKAYSIVTAMDIPVTLADLIKFSDLEDYRIVSMTVFRGWVNGSVALEWMLNRPGWETQMRSQYPTVTIERFVNLAALGRVDASDHG